MNNKEEILTGLIKAVSIISGLFVAPIMNTDFLDYSMNDNE